MGKWLRKRESLTILMTLLAASKKKRKAAMNPIRAASPGRIPRSRGTLLVVRARRDSMGWVVFRDFPTDEAENGTRAMCASR
jgi:hypothetical protein